MRGGGSKGLERGWALETEELKGMVRAGGMGEEEKGEKGRNEGGWNGMPEPNAVAAEEEGVKGSSCGGRI